MRNVVIMVLDAGGYQLYLNGLAVGDVYDNLAAAENGARRLNSLLAASGLRVEFIEWHAGSEVRGRIQLAAGNDTEPIAGALPRDDARAWYERFLAAIATADVVVSKAAPYYVYYDGCRVGGEHAKLREAEHMGNVLREVMKDPNRRVEFTTWLGWDSDSRVIRYGKTRLVRGTFDEQIGKVQPLDVAQSANYSYVKIFSPSAVVGAITEPEPLNLVDGPITAERLKADGFAERPGWGGLWWKHVRYLTYDRGNSEVFLVDVHLPRQPKTMYQLYRALYALYGEAPGGYKWVD